MAEYNLLDTGAFDSFINSRKGIQDRYNNIQKEYSKIVEELLKHWKGRGADAFERDAEKVISNLVGINDILSTMCDTLSDCYDIFSECDNSLGINNRNAVEN